MSKLNINRNIFLEKEELERFQKFIGADSVVAQTVLNNTLDWGIVRTVFSGTNTDFLVQAGTNTGTIKIGADSIAIDIDKLLITQKAIDNISVPDDSTYYWVKISHEYSPLEVGECSINVNGEVSGVNTLFTEVLRGQSTEVPVKIKFYKEGGAVNDQVYEVVDVTDDLNIILSGSGFTAESALSYMVIGSTPIGEVLTSSQLDGLYQYDSCVIELIAEETLDTAPVTNFVEDKQFYIARVVNTGGVLTIEDKRENWWSFYIPGIDDKLDSTLNLSDLANVVTARTNLGVYSKTEVDALLAVSSTTVTTNYSVHSTISSLVTRATYNKYSVTVAIDMEISNEVAAGTLLFYMVLPSAGVTGTFLAGMNMSQPGDFNDSRTWQLRAEKYINPITGQNLVYFYAVNKQTQKGNYLANFAWLPI